MCDYSLMNVKSRAAKVGDKLVSHNFGSGTIGFADATDLGNLDTAICVLPGTEIAFERDVEVYGGTIFPYVTKVNHGKTAIFRQINKEVALTHHDALEFADGKSVLLTSIPAGHLATVIQMPVVEEPRLVIEERAPAYEGMFG